MDTAVLRAKRAFISDMDGVIYHGNELLPGTKEFVEWLKENDKEYLFLTNSSARSPRELREKLLRLGLDVPEQHFYTSAMSTASFLAQQKPSGSAYVIGDPGLLNALYGNNYSVNDVNPDYVVVGPTSAYSYDKIIHAIQLIRNGAQLIGTDPDISGPLEGGDLAPGGGALVAPIEMVTGCSTYFLGKPNPLMMRNALKAINCRREETVIIGDRMDTDIIAGIEADIDTVLVLSGVTQKEDIKKFSYNPTYVLPGLKALLPLLKN